MMYTIIFAKDLRPDDVIIHNSLIFKVEESGLADASDNTFGAEVLVTGYYLNNARDEFYTFQDCPLVKVEN